MVFLEIILTKTAAAVQSGSDYIYTNTSVPTTNSDLNGKQGVSHLGRSAGSYCYFNSGTVIGSATNPVILIVNGNLSVSGSVNIYGFIYVTGNLTSSGIHIFMEDWSVYGNVSDSGNYHTRI